MKLKLKITTSSPQDIHQIKDLLDLAFKQQAEGILVEKLFTSESFIPELSLLGYAGSNLVAYILFTKLQINTKAGNVLSLALAPMAVHPDYQKQGLGKQLVEAALSKAKTLGYPSVIVLGHAEYYPKFGFEPASKWHITCPFPVPDEVFMGLELIPNALLDKAGAVVYAKEFTEM